MEGIKHIWVWDMDNIKVDLQETGWQSFDLVNDRDRWWELRNILNFRVLQNAEIFLTSWKTVTFSRRILLHGVLSLVSY